MTREQLDKLLIDALLCSTRAQYSQRYVNLLTPEGLYKAFCELQSNVTNNHHTKEKCSFIIMRIDNEETLKDMVILTKSYTLVGEALAKIHRYTLLKEIADKRPDLDVHVKGRLGFVSNANRFILDD